jgi:hypothetical protein
MALYIKIIIGIIVISFFVPSNPRMNELRVKGHYKLARFIETFLLIVVIICQWTWYVLGVLLIINIIKAII